jgi:hypothetical protein
MYPPPLPLTSGIASLLARLTSRDKSLPHRDGDDQPWLVDEREGPLVEIGRSYNVSAATISRLARVHQLNSIFAIFRVSDHDNALVLKSRCL